MSVRIMAAAWALDLSSTDKLVLLALADWSNDDGACWPSMAQLAKKSGLTDRAIRASVARLVEAGHLTRDENPGKGVHYTVHPGTTFRPERASPRNDVPKTPERRSANTSGTTNSQKDKPSGNKRARKAPAFVVPEDIPADEWRDYEEMRRVTRKPMTDSIRAKAVSRLRKLAADGWPPGDVLSHSTLNNYQGLFPPKDDENATVRRHRGPASRPPDAFSAVLQQQAGYRPSDFG